MLRTLRLPLLVLLVVLVVGGALAWTARDDLRELIHGPAADSSLETSATGWLAHSQGISGAGWARSQVWAASGSWSIRQAGTAGGNEVIPGVKGFVGSYEPVFGGGDETLLVGKTYTASTKVKVTDVPKTGPGIWQELFFYDAKGKQLSQVNGTSLGQPVKRGEQTVSCTAVVPYGAVKVQPVIVMATGTPGDSMEFFADDASVVRAGN